MALHIEAIGADKIDATLHGMTDQIDKLGKQEMATELTAWQAEDMKRTYPNTKQEDDKTVSTEIWPRSRLSETRKPNTAEKRVRVYAPPRGGPRVSTSTRPILRSELFKTLCNRMAELLNRVLQWQTKA